MKVRSRDKLSRAMSTERYGDFCVIFIPSQSLRQCDATAAARFETKLSSLNSSHRVVDCWLNLHSCLERSRKSQLCCDVTDTCVWSAVTQNQNCAVPFHQLARVGTKSSPQLFRQLLAERSESSVSPCVFIAQLQFKRVDRFEWNSSRMIY